MPRGFVRYAGAGFTVAHPKGWKVSTGRDDSGAQVVKIVAPGGDAGSGQNAGKNSPGTDGPGKDGAGRDGAGKDGAGKDGAGKDAGGKEGAGADGGDTEGSDTDSGGKDRAELLIGRLPGYKGDFASRIAAFRSSAELAGRKIVAQRAMSIPGARQAWRLDLTYPAPKAKDNGPEGTIRMEDLQVLGTDRTLTEVAVRAREDAFAHLALSQVLPTFRLT